MTGLKRSFRQGGALLLAAVLTFGLAGCEKLQAEKKLKEENISINAKTLCEKAFNGNSETVALLLKAGADVNGQYQGAPPLYYALKGGTELGVSDDKVVATAKALVVAGADVNATFQTTNMLETAMLAGQAAVADLLKAKGAKLPAGSRVTLAPSVAEYPALVKGNWYCQPQLKESTSDTYIFEVRSADSSVRHFPGTRLQEPFSYSFDNDQYRTLNAYKLDGRRLTEKYEGDYVTNQFRGMMADNQIRAMQSGTDARTLPSIPNVGEIYKSSIIDENYYDIRFYDKDYMAVLKQKSVIDGTNHSLTNPEAERTYICNRIKELPAVKKEPLAEAQPVSAVEPTSADNAVSVAYTDGDGHEYKSTANANGVTLKSAATTILLENSCGASSPQYGKGTWGWANGGFMVDFKNQTIGFPRQEIEIDNNGGCRR